MEADYSDDGYIPGISTLQKVSQFQLISWWENFVETHSVLKVSGKSPETLQKLYFILQNFYTGKFAACSDSDIVSYDLDLRKGEISERKIYIKKQFQLSKLIPRLFISFIYKFVVNCYGF